MTAPGGPQASVCLVQMRGGDDRAANVAHAIALVEEAAGHGAQIVCLPELFNLPYFCHEEDSTRLALAEPVPGPTVDAIAELARRLSIVIVAPLYELAADGRRYNTAVTIDVDGSIVGHYRKSSIPRSLLPNWTSLEQYYFAPGDTGFEVVSTPFGINLGVLICYDRHFPEAARVLALRGADLILVPTATGGPAASSWAVELRAHAIANICYVGGVNRVGRDAGDPSRPHYFGSSLIVGCDGHVLAQAGDAGEELIYAQVNKVTMTELRKGLGWFRDRRPDLYAELTNPLLTAIEPTAQSSDVIPSTQNVEAV
nr:nitrilase-related carbon-nitrogen hydrolase [Propionicimonas sp.]